MEAVYAFLSVGVVSLVSFVGILLLSLRMKKGESSTASLFVGLAVGALIGDTTIHLMPEAYGELGLRASFLFMGGFLVFFAMEKFLHWRHGHHLRERHGIQPVGIMNLVADGMHNLIDGALIGASYLISIPIGAANTIAVILHEIPQEVGDFGILVHAGFKPKWAVVFNFISAVFAFIGLGLALKLGTQVEEFAPQVIAFTAGGFIYIVAVLVRQLSKEMTTGRAIAQLAAASVGVLVMWLLLFFE